MLSEVRSSASVSLNADDWERLLEGMSSEGRPRAERRTPVVNWKRVLEGMLSEDEDGVPERLEQRLGMAARRNVE